MNILFCVWGNICEPDFYLSLVQMGHHVEQLQYKIKNKDYDEGMLKLLSEELKRDSYDFVFSANFVPIIARVCHVFHIKYLSWTVDSPLFQLYSETVEYDENYIFLFDNVLYEKWKNKNPGHIFHLPLASNVDYFDSLFISKEDKEKYSCEVSFVGSLYEDKHDYDKVAIPARLKGYLNGVLEAQVRIYGYFFLEEVISEEMAKEFRSYANWNSLGEDYRISEKEILVNEFLGKKCSEIERKRIVEMLAKYYDFHLYTLSDTASMKTVKNCGAASSRLEMPKIFQCSKININPTIKTIQSGVPLRVFDVLACKGFLITNYQSEFAEHFTIGEDLVVYENLEDLKQKINYYLYHDEERKAIARRGYQKVKSCHTYQKRFEKMFSIVYQTTQKTYAFRRINKYHYYVDFFHLMLQLKMNRILDVGLFLARAGGITRNCNQLELPKSLRVDALSLFGEKVFPIHRILYETIDTLDSFQIQYYDMIVFLNVISYIKKEEAIQLMKQMLQFCSVMLIEDEEMYQEVIGKIDCKKIPIQMGKSKFLLLQNEEGSSLNEC